MSQPSPFNKFRNVSFRKPLARTRTPSLSRTTPSPDSSSANSTPRSGRSVVLSPAITVQGPDPDDVIQELISSDDHQLSLHHVQEHNSLSLEDASQTFQNQFDREHRPELDAVQPNVQGQSEEESRDDREPTFSSEEGPTPYPQESLIPGNTRSLGIPASTFSSPALSAVFTPTPAILPRPRARFNDPIPLHTPLQRQSQLQDDGPVTPFNRRRSFLLSVINTETRPRLKFPTPHPRRTNFSDQTDEQFTPGPNLLSAFAGVTPRPRARARLSHPLAQTYLASPATSASVSASPTAPELGSSVIGALPQWSTPSNEDDRASFISTASSHDLTTHHRVNMSFDPVMGLAAQGHGVGRFNAGKLNTYLHGLNRRLQEENEGLVERLSKIEEEKAGVAAGRRLSGLGGGSRRVSLVGSALGDVEEDVSGEGWVEEKAELEKMVEGFREEVRKCIAEREAVESKLEEERAERTRDKDRWRERMVEVEQGVEVIIKELENKLKDAEKRARDVEEDKAEIIKDLRKKLVEAEGQRDLALDRVENAEHMLESGRELGGELKGANERVSKMMADLRNANVQIRELEEEVMTSDGRIDELEKELKEEKEFIKSLEDELQTRLGELTAAREDLKNMEDGWKKVEVESQAIKTYAEELEEDAGLAVERIESLEGQLATAHARIKSMTASEIDLNEKLDELTIEAKRNAQLVRQTEDTLRAAEKKMTADEEQLSDLKGEILSLRRQKDLDSLRGQENPTMYPSRGGPTEAEVEALEVELEKANRDIGRLNALLQQSPARKAMDKAKDAKIEMLEVEKAELMERVRALRTTVTEMGTPNKFINASGISPIHRQVLSMSIRGPKTPGGPLRDVRTYPVQRQSSHIFYFRCHGSTIRHRIPPLHLS
jgi:chromosome segregation ATPase